MDHDRRSHKRSRHESGEQMCRDFEKGTCFRGERCKFQHPQSDGNGVSKIPFCKDFRQGACKFRECIYVHGPVVLEEEYLKTGWVPRFVLRHCLERFNLCIQYLKENGFCSKGDSCKFGHAMLGLELSKADFDFSRELNHHMNIEQVCRMCGLCIDFVRDNCTKGEECKYKHCSPAAVQMGNDKTTWEDVRNRESDNGYIRGGRGGLLDGQMMDGGMMGGGGPMMGNMGMMGGGPMMDAGMGGFSREEFMMVKRDNEMLRMEVMELRKKNEGLKATNQFLLEENASMRMKQQMGGGGSKAGQFDGSNQTGGYSSSSSGYGGSSGYGSSGGGGGYGGTGGGSSGYGGGSNTSPSPRYSTGRGGAGGW